MFKKIYVEITNNCNFNCPFCSKSSLPKIEMTLGEFEHVLKEIKPYTNYIYLHVKGEPLYHSNFKEIILLCEKYNFKVNITTNGSLIEKQKNILLNKCIRQINISLQSYQNLDVIKSIIDVCDNLSKKKIIVYRFWALDNMNLSRKNKEINDYIEMHLQNLDDIQRKNIHISKNSLFDWPSLDSKEFSNGYCLGTKTHVGILASGEVIPCCLDSDGIVNLGNIFDAPFKNIIESKRFKNIQEDFKKNKCSEELCKHCTYKNRFKNISTQ